MRTILFGLLIFSNFAFAGTSLCGIPKGELRGTYASDNPYICGLYLALAPDDVLIGKSIDNLKYSNTYCARPGVLLQYRCDPQINAFVYSDTYQDGPKVKSWRCEIKPEDDTNYRFTQFCYDDGELYSMQTYFKWVP